MKKKVLCVFSLILYILIACTVLAEKIEVEMRTQIEIWTVKSSNSFLDGLKISTGYLFREADGEHLFEIQEGSGWESGLRIQEISNQDWQMNYDSEPPMVELTSTRNYTFIRTASRVPHTGETVEIIKEPETASDIWLVYYPEGVPEYEKLPSGMELIDRNEQTLLLSLEKSKFPFFEHRAVGDDLKQLAGNGMRVFSLTAAEEFLSQLPSLAMAALFLLIPVILWIVSCFLSVDTGQNKWLIAVNIALAIGSVILLRAVLSGIDLPAAMLPSGNILNWQHYREEFSLIFGAMEAFGEEAKQLFSVQSQAAERCEAIWLSGIALTLAVILAEVFWVVKASAKSDE